MRLRKRKRQIGSPMGPDIHLTDSDRYGSKKVVCGTFINRGSRADIISLPATLRQLL